MAKKKQRQPGHRRGIGCDAYYDAIREQRKCSCGRQGTGVSRFGPVCIFHDSFPTMIIQPFPPIPECPGPHTEE